MDATLVYGPELARYDLGPDHPLRPERFELAVELMEAYGLVPEGTAKGAPEKGAVAPLGIIAPATADDHTLALVHSATYIALVKEAGAHPGRFLMPRAGLGTMDTPVFHGMHEAAALVAGAAVVAADEVVSGRSRRALSVAGGLHHAHRDHAAGFCVYNDCAVAIAHALGSDPDTRVLYVDIDAHHGDGVQTMFWDDPRVLTVSVHETGMALYPGTGFARERGGQGARGYTANVALPPGATDACYRLTFEEAVAPLARAFAPGIVFAQCGADAHHADPLTSLGLTLPGYAWLVRSIVSLADEVSAGGLVAFGGGGYGWEHVVPRAWTILAAALTGVTLPETLPERWRELARETSGEEPPRGLTEDRLDVAPAAEARALDDTRAAVDELMAGPGPAA